jgi:hypothetical protein
VVALDHDRWVRMSPVPGCALMWCAGPPVPGGKGGSARHTAA